MITGILATDGGPHSAVQWAEATASHIVSIAEGISGDKQTSALKLQAAVIDILLGAHTSVQAGERGGIAADPARLIRDLNANDHVNVDDVVAQIVSAGSTTPWGADMATPEFASQLQMLLYSHLHTSMNIERSWHADRNPESPHAQAFKANHNVGV